MTEIKIEKKKPIWPWIVVALIIAALIYYLANQEDDGTEGTTIESTSDTSAVIPTDHNDFQTYHL